MTGADLVAPVAERITDALCEHGEGPVWDARTGSIRWVDMVNGDVYGLRVGETCVDAEPTRVHVDAFVAALRPRTSGGWVLATERGFALTDDALRVEARIPAFSDDIDARMNDGGCDPRGNFLCGTAGPDGAGSVYRFAPSGEIDVALSDVTISNGLAAEPHGRFLYYVDTPTRRIDRIDLHDGAIGDRRPFVDLSSEPGLPDGIAVDAAGGVWVAMWGAGEVLHVSSQGELDHRIGLPTPLVSACAFGGPNLDQLFITTSRMGLDGPDEFAGSLFRAASLNPGLPPLGFGG